MRYLILISLVSFAFLINSVISEYNLTIVHVTDFHSHWFEFNENEKKCSKEESQAGKCYGGFARLVTLVNDIRSNDQNVIVLSAGEFFLGRSLNGVHGWKMANAFLPYLSIDAMSLANHDFSSGMFDLSAFLYGMKFPVLCSNMWARNTSFIYSRVNKSDILNVGGEKIGIIGYLHPDTLEKSRRAVSVKFSPEIPAIQKEVKRLESEGVNKIIALGHSGYKKDMEISQKVKGVDIVIGGNSDIILDDREEASTVGNIHGNYPRVHQHENEIDTGEIVKNKTLILHIPQHGKYVGKIKVTFDDDGKVIDETGEAILLDNKIKQDEGLVQLLEEAGRALEEVAEHSHLPDAGQKLAFATDIFESRGCRLQECTLGNLVTDALLQEYQNQDIDGDREWRPVDAVIFNAGALRYSLLAGPITIKDLLHSLFVGDFIPRVKLSGQTLKKFFEHSVKRYDIHGVDNPGSFLQISGLRVIFDMEEKPGNRVHTLLVQRKGSFQEVEPNKTYIVAMPDFIANGGDGFLKLSKIRDEDKGKLEVVYLVDYLKEMGRVTPKLDGRITVMGALWNKNFSKTSEPPDANKARSNLDIQAEDLRSSTPQSLTTPKPANILNKTQNVTNKSIDEIPSIHFGLEEKNESLKHNQLDSNYTETPLVLSNTSLKSDSKTINSSVQDLVQTMLPELNSTTLLHIIENADSFRKGVSIDKSLENKVTVTSLTPNEVTTLASNISNHKALGEIFSSIMKDHKNGSETSTLESSTKEGKAVLSPQTSFSTNKPGISTEKDDHYRHTLNDTIAFVESFNELQDLLIDSVIASLIDNAQENGTRKYKGQEQPEPTNMLNVTREGADRDLKISAKNFNQTSSLSPNNEKLDTISKSPDFGNKTSIEKGKVQNNS